MFFFSPHGVDFPIGLLPCNDVERIRCNRNDSRPQPDRGRRSTSRSFPFLHSCVTKHLHDSGKTKHLYTYMLLALVVADIHSINRDMHAHLAGHLFVAAFSTWVALRADFPSGSAL